MNNELILAIIITLITEAVVIIAAKLIYQQYMFNKWKKELREKKRIKGEQDLANSTESLSGTSGRLNIN